MRICNGRLGLDKGIGKYTYVGSTGSSVVDYVLISENIISTISKFSIDEPNILSDHCAVFFSLSNVIHGSQAHINDTPPGEKVSKKFIWNSEETQNYRNNISLYEEDFLLMQTELFQATSGQVINENIDRFSKVMSNICDPLFAKTVNPNKCNASIGYDIYKQTVIV